MGDFITFEATEISYESNYFQFLAHDFMSVSRFFFARTKFVGRPELDSVCVSAESTKLA